MLVSGRMARAFFKMALKSSMDALAGSPSRCLKSKINGNRTAHNVGLSGRIASTFSKMAQVQHGGLGGQSLPLPKE
jgi:hypothetical protein